MEIYHAGHEDIEQLVQIRMAYLYDDMGTIAEEQLQSIQNQLPAYFTEHLGRDMIALIAKDKEKIIASAMMVMLERPANTRFITGRTGEILSVYTMPEYRRQGMAKKLMEQLLLYAKAEKLDFVELKATKDGFPLYKKLGFEEEQQRCVPMKYSI